ncbi:MAG: BTAD domain-containing putative transcriptional regulator [Caldilineaceae bacterium]
MSRLEVKLLGTPQISLAGVPLNDLGMRKAEAILFYLAVNQRPYTRTALAGLLWPEVDETDARNNLRRVLPRLRARIGDHLRIDRQTVAFDPQAAYWLDVEHFTTTLAAFAQPTSPVALDFAQLAQALTLYQGEFLAGFYVRAAPAFEEWVLAQREQLRILAVRGLTTLADCYIAQGAHSAGLAATQQLLTIEPWSEVAHFQQMVLLAQSGQRAAALAQYEQCRTLLATEFGAQPLPLLTAFYEQFQTGAYEAALQSILQRSASKPGELMAAQRTTPPTTASDRLLPLPRAATNATSTGATVALQVEWGEFPHTAAFYGREAELRQLTQWLTAERSPLVLVLGVGGVGKTTLAAHWIQQMVQHATAPLASAPPFTRVIWRSLRNAPPLTAILRMWLQALTDQQLTTWPGTVDEQIDRLFTHLRRMRCLLVLDNWESLLQAGDTAGGYLPGYENYGLLLQRMSEGQHQSSLLLTSREANLAMARLGRDTPAVRTLALSGMPVATGIELLQATGLKRYDDALVALVQRYSGNPLALKLVAETVQTYYQGDSAAFLQTESALFDDIQQVLDQQVTRTSPLEWAILRWLAIERTPVTARRLQQNFVQPPAHGALLAALRALHRRSLIEQTLVYEAGRRAEEIHFGLQNVVLEYLTDRLQATMRDELTRETLHDFLHFALVQAQALDYVRAAQVQLLLHPLAQRLANAYGKAGVARKLAQVLQTVRTVAPEPVGYGAANLLHLAFHLGIPVTGWDFSHLTIRQADLRNRRLPAVNFAQADFVQTAFMEKFQAILAVAVSPDGDLIAAGGASGDLYLWRLQDGQRLALGPGHGRWLWAVTFSPDGALIASGTAGGAILLWSVADLTQMPATHAATSPWAATLHGHSDAVFGLAFHPTQPEVASASADQTIRLWDLTRKEVRRTLLGHTASVYAVAYHPTGAFLASAGRDQTIRLWTLATGECRPILTPHQALITQLCFSSDGAWLVSSSVDGVIAVWQIQGADQADTVYLQLDQQIGPEPTEIVALALSRDGETIAANGPDATIRLWQRTTGTLLRTLAGHSATVQALAFSPDGQRLVSGAWDQSLRYWQLATGAGLRTWQGYTNEVTALALSPDGHTLISATTDATLARWDDATRQVGASQPTTTGAALALAFHPDGQRLAVGGEQGLRLWTVTTDALTLRQSLRGHTDAIVALAFHPAGALLASGSRDCTIRLWDDVTGGLRQVLSAHHRTVEAVTFSPDGRWLVSGDDGGQLFGWQPTTAAEGEWTPTLLGEIPGGITTLAFSPDGALLAGAGPDHTIFLWRVADATLLATIPVPVYSTVYTLAFHPNTTGDRLALISGSGNGALACWSVEPQTGAAQLRYLQQEHQRSVRALCITPDGETIISGSADETIKCWQLESGVCWATLTLAQPYQGMTITGATGLTPAQQTALQALGACNK